MNVAQYSYEKSFDGGGRAALDRWIVRHDSDEITWSGFHTGPIVLSLYELDQLAVALGVDSTIRLFPSNVSKGTPAVILHSATRTTGGFEGDFNAEKNNTLGHDCATYLETRSPILATPQDLLIGRTAPWKEAVTSMQNKFLDVGHCEYYYLSDALLVCSKEWSIQGNAAIDDLIQFLKINPTSIFRLYSLDEPISLFLRWLAQQAGLSAVHVEANGERVAVDWNCKEILYPTIAKTSGLKSKGVNLHSLLKHEMALAPISQLMGKIKPLAPGYILERKEHSLESFVVQTLTAAHRLVDIYAIIKGCLKPSNGGDGARIVTNIDLYDSAILRKLAVQAYHYGGAYILEPHIHFLTAYIDGREMILAPSAHINNSSASGVTLQTLDGYSWNGNIYIDRKHCGQFGLPTTVYDEIVEVMSTFSQRFNALAVKQGDSAKLIKGGVDFAVGRLDSLLGDEVGLFLQDPNLSSHGAEYLYSFMDSVGYPYASTKVIRPKENSNLALGNELSNNYSANKDVCSVISSVPGRWAMIASAAQTPLDSFSAVNRFQRYLIHKGFC